MNLFILVYNDQLASLRKLSLRDVLNLRSETREYFNFASVGGHIRF